MKKLLVLGAACAVLLLAACSGSADNAAPPLDVTLIATDIAYDQEQIQIKAGQRLRVALQNDGALEHDFTIETLPHSPDVRINGFDAAMLSESDHGDGHMGMDLDIHLHVVQGDRGTIEFTPTSAGEYRFYCTVAGHEEAGMIGTLVVTP